MPVIREQGQTTKKKVSRVGGSAQSARPRATASKNKPVRAMSESEVKRRLRGLQGDARLRAVCAFVGHSRIQTFCFGYFNCGRCGDQVGDALASVYPGAASAVIVGHDCAKCRENATSLTWRDTLYAPDPFAEAK